MNKKKKINPGDNFQSGKISRRKFLRDAAVSAVFLAGSLMTGNSIAFPAETVFTRTVGPSGDTIEYSDGLRLLIPAKALKKNTKISIETIQDPSGSNKLLPEKDPNEDRPVLLYGFNPPPPEDSGQVSFLNDPVCVSVYKFSPEALVFSKDVAIYFPVTEKYEGLGIYRWNVSSWEAVEVKEYSKKYLLIKTKLFGIYSLSYKNV
jgi:hypothetical protein